MKGKRKSERKRQLQPDAAPPDESCLEQANICCEQARTAARLKRYTAARGLFVTAIALCHRAIALNGTARPQAEICLGQLHNEMSAYSELARSMERPLLAHTHMQSHQHTEFAVTV